MSEPQPSSENVDRQNKALKGSIEAAGRALKNATSEYEQAVAASKQFFADNSGELYDIALAEDAERAEYQPTKDRIETQEKKALAVPPSESAIREAAFMGIPHPEVAAAHDQKMDRIRQHQDDVSHARELFFGPMSGETADFGSDEVDYMSTDEIIATNRELDAYRAEKDVQIKVAEQDLKDYYDKNQAAVQENAPVIMENDLEEREALAQRRQEEKNRGWTGNSHSEDEEG